MMAASTIPTRSARPGTGAHAVGPEPVKILLVDDLPENWLVYRTVLAELGAEIVTAASGADALKQILKTDFAVILLDVNMPDMDGFETALTIRSRRRSAHTPIIFLTAFTDDVKIAQGYATGAVDYLPTPVVPEILRAKVRVFIDLFRMRHRLAQQAEEQAQRATAEELARRSTFLANASHALANSLDYEATLRALVRLPLGHLADASLVTLADAHGRAGRSHGARLDANGIVHYEQVATVDGLEDWLARLVHRTLELQKLEMLLRLHAPSALFRPLPGEAAETYDSAIVIPLVARGKILGAYALALREGQGPWEPANIELAQEFAGRAGIALENAALVRDIQENDRRKNEFLATLAHELRNPLAPIRNALRAIELSGGDAAVIEQSRPMLERQVSQLVRLVDDLLDVSRINRNVLELRKERVAFADIVAGALETSRPLVESFGHSLHVQLPPEPLGLEVDSTRLAQVFSNLLNNAAKYTERGGNIWLTAERRLGEITVRVRDDGIGIPADAMANIFELFSQIELHQDRAQGGLGIGLNLVRKIVEMHGGTVEAFSAGTGRGSEFIVHLPFVEGIALPGSEVAEPAGPAAKGRRILVVDDNVDSAESLGWMLGYQGHDVRTAHDGHAALAIVAEFRPDVVLLDIGMPKMNGYETARRIRGESWGKGLLLIAQTGWGKDEDRKLTREAGFDHHLVKPVDPAALEALLGEPNSA